MIIKEIDLHEDFASLPLAESKTSFTGYIRNKFGFYGEDFRYPAVIIMPGGGYTTCSDREGEPVALRFVAEGFCAFILKYPVAPDRYPKALLYASAAVAYLRRHADELNIDPARISVCGFSAAGHLCATLGAFWDEAFVSETLSLSPEENKPDALILGYPVITTTQFQHQGSVKNLLGDDPDPELLDKLSIDKSANSKFPPTFMWHTYNDGSVPLENSLFLAVKLRECNVPMEYHIFRDGPHGLSLCEMTSAMKGRDGHINPHCAKWFGLCVEWLKETLNISDRP